jgi:hypothetical protein
MSIQYVWMSRTSSSGRRKVSVSTRHSSSLREPRNSNIRLTNCLRPNVRSAMNRQGDKNFSARTMGRLFRIGFSRKVSMGVSSGRRRNEFVELCYVRRDRVGRQTTKENLPVARMLNSRVEQAQHLNDEVRKQSRRVAILAAQLNICGRSDATARLYLPTKRKIVHSLAPSRSVSRRSPANGEIGNFGG